MFRCSTEGGYWDAGEGFDVKWLKPAGSTGGIRKLIERLYNNTTSCYTLYSFSLA